MYQIEEFNKYIYRQVKGDENQEMLEEHREEKIWKMEMIIKIFGSKKICQKISKKIEEVSNRLNPEHKRYITYTMDFKKLIIQEVNKNNNI